MSLFRRNEIWYASYSLPGGKRIKESLGTKDKRQAQELHDKRKAELWRVEKLGDLPDVTFEEACLRWLEEKADKKSLDSDKSRIEFWLEHFEGIRLKDITVKSFDGDGIYAFLYDDTAHVKRLQMMKDKLLVISDNKSYSPWDPIEKDEMNRVFIFGKVIGSMPQTYRKHG